MWIIGLYLALNPTNSTTSIVIETFSFLLGEVSIILILLDLIGLPRLKVFGFTHLTKKSNIYRTKRYSIIELSKKETDRLLKLYQNKPLSEIFKEYDIIIGSSNKSFIGYIYAKSESEALTILKSHQFSDPDNED